MSHQNKLILAICGIVALVAMTVGLVLYFGEKNSICVVENCHGLEVACGKNAPQMCTEMYALGDKCLQFAQCGVVGKKCQQIPDTRFTRCKTCVQNCEAKYSADPEQAFRCEAECGN